MITDPWAQYGITLGVMLILTAFICMGISFFKARQTKSSFFVYIGKNDSFIKFMSWVAVVVLCLGLFAGVMKVTHDLIF